MRALAAPAFPEPGADLIGSSVHNDAPPPADEQAPWFLRAAVAGDAFALAWSAEPPTATPAVTLAALVRGGEAAAQAVGAPLRDNAGAVPLALADGTPGVVWADDMGVAHDARPAFAGLHVALAGRPAAADAPPPQVVVATDVLRIHHGDPIRFGVTCSAACDLLATAPLSSHDEYGGSASAGADGHTELRMFIPTHGSIARVRVQVSAPGSHLVASQQVAIPLAYLPPVPLPRLVDVRARRDGPDLVVRWHTSIPARHVRFVVYAGATEVDVDGLGRRAFSARLRGEGGRRSVTLAAATGERTRSLRVRVS